MQFKKLLKALLLAVPVIADCNLDNLDDPKCAADILIITTSDKETDPGYTSVVETLKKFSVPTNKYIVKESGANDAEIKKVIYKNEQQGLGRYKAIVFPNGRVSYQGNGQWASALDKSQWAIFEEYSAKTNYRIVYLNEYPSAENTGTKLATANPTNDNNFKMEQSIIVPEDRGEIAADLNSSNLNTSGTYHYPAIIDENEVKLNNFEEVVPILYFGPAAPEYPEQTVAGVSCTKSGGAKYAALFTSFGDWSRTSNALNVYWLTWALDTDISRISDSHLTTKEAIEKANDAPRSIKLGMAVVLSSLSAIVLAMF